MPGFAAAPKAVAQEHFGQSWENLPPDKRKQKREQYFADLPESRQQRLRESQRRFHALSPDDKRAMCERFVSQRGYAPPACRNIPDN